jgi:hypothetical protein
MAVVETPKHVVFLVDVNNKEFGCVRLNIMYQCTRICLNMYTAGWTPSKFPEESFSILLTTINVLDISFRENKRTQLTFNNIFRSRSSCILFWEIVNVIWYAHCMLCN